MHFNAETGHNELDITRATGVAPAQGDRNFFVVYGWHRIAGRKRLARTFSAGTAEHGHNAMVVDAIRGGDSAAATGR